MNRDSAEILIVGGGVIGLSCALRLLEDGRAVRVIERARPGAGSSSGSCGTITPSHAPPLAAPGMVLQGLRWMLQPDAPFYVRPRWDPALFGWMARFALRCNARDFARVTALKAPLLRRSRELLERWTEDAGLDCQFRDSGLRYVFRDERAFEHERAQAAALAVHGIESRSFDAASTLAAEPALCEGVIGSLVFPGDACLRPDRLMAALERRVLERGGEIETGNAVLAIDDIDGGVRVDTANGPREGSHALLAAGSWSPEFQRRLRLKLPIQPGKGYSITYTRPQLAPSTPLVLWEPHVCVTTWDDGFRLGSTMEFSGYDDRLNARRLQALERGARAYLREPVGERVLERWFGWRPMTWDDLPIIGAHPRRPRLLLATGHGMLGVSLSAVTAELIADGIAGRSSAIDPAPFSPARFG